MNNITWVKSYLRKAGYRKENRKVTKTGFSENLMHCHMADQPILAAFHNESETFGGVILTDGRFTTGTYRLLPDGILNIG